MGRNRVYCRYRLPMVGCTELPRNWVLLLQRGKVQQENIEKGGVLAVWARGELQGSTCPECCPCPELVTGIFVIQNQRTSIQLHRVMIMQEQRLLLLTSPFYFPRP